MTVESSASWSTCACSYEWVIPALDPPALQRLRTSLARWAAGGTGTARCWQIGRALTDHVHVVVRMPLDETISLEELAPEIDGVARTVAAA